ncbi:MAG: VC0807 family protein [Janthinobacterium lividum]
MAQAAPARGEKPASGVNAAVGWLVTIGVNIVLPIVTFTLLAGTGMNQVVALLLSSVWPVLEMVVTLVRQRHIDEFSLFVLIGIVIGLLTGIFSDSTRAVFLKDSITTGLLGVVFLVTLPFKPLTFFLARRFATDGSEVQRDWWDGLWQYPTFRRTQRGLGAAWGVALIGEAAVRAVLTYSLGPQAMVVVNNVVPYVVIAGMVFVSITVGRRSRAAAQRRHGQSALPPTQVAQVGDAATEVR